MSEQLLRQSLKQRLAVAGSSQVETNAKVQQTLEKRSCPGPYKAATYGTLANYANHCTLTAYQSLINFVQGKDFISCYLPMIVSGPSGYQFF